MHTSCVSDFSSKQLNCIPIFWIIQYNFKFPFPLFYHILGLSTKKVGGTTGVDVWLKIVFTHYYIVPISI